MYKKPILGFLAVCFLIFSCTKFEVIEPCEIHFDNTFSTSEINCSLNPFAQDVVEIPGEGFLICGNCDRSNGLIIQVDLDGNLSCSRSGYAAKNSAMSTNAFFGIGRNPSNGAVLLTGYSDDSPDFVTGASAYNVKWNAGCDGGTEDILDSTVGTIKPPDLWDVGNSPIGDPFDNHFVIAGKWEGYPALFKVDPNNIGTSGIIDSIVLRLDFFQDPNININIVPPIPEPGQPYSPPSHDILDVIKTSDNAFVAVGWLDVITSGNNTIRKAFLFKTKKNELTLDWIRFYSKEEFPTVITRKSLRAYKVLEINNDYVIVGDGFDQEIPVGDPNAIQGSDLNGIIIHVAKNNGDVEAFNDLDIGSENFEDHINAICPKHNDGNRYLVTGKNTDPSNAATQQAFIKEYYRSGATIVAGDISQEGIGNQNDFTSGDAILAAEDGGYFVLINMKTGGANGSHNGFRAIKTDSKGEFQ